jgi:DNA replication initiation complex subunit (GINS family)
MQFMGKCLSGLGKAEEDFVEDIENLIKDIRISHLEYLLEFCHIY